MTSETARQRRRAQRKHRWRGCMASCLLTIVLCVGVVRVTDSQQTVEDAFLDLAQQEGLLQEDSALGMTLSLMNSQSEQAAQSLLSVQEVLASLEAETAIFDDGITRYYYTTLTDAEKITYISIAQCVFDMAEEAEIPTQGSMVLADIWPLVRGDFPEIFWVESSLTRTVTQGGSEWILFVPTYNLTADERSAGEAAIEQTAREYYASLAEDATDYQKVQAAYEFVIEQVSYLANDDDQTVYGALAQRQAVCAGYARAVQYLLNHVGVVCCYVSGEASSAGEQFSHAWNVVCIEGDYYYLDATWGEDNWGTGVDYSYLCVSALDLAASHSADTTYQIPAIEGTDYNYYRVIGAYLEEYSADAVQEAMLLQKGAGYYTLRFADEESAQQALSALIESQEIYAILRAIDDTATSLGYTYKEALQVLTVYPNMK